MCLYRHLLPVYSLNMAAKNAKYCYLEDAYLSHTFNKHPFKNSCKEVCFYLLTLTLPRIPLQPS